MKVDNWDIVRDFRAARGRLRLGPYERYLAEHIAARVALLLGKRDEGTGEGIARGTDSKPAGERFRRSPLTRAARERTG